jgi:hypothetical protein
MRLMKWLSHWDSNESFLSDWDWERNWNKANILESVDF